MAETRRPLIVADTRADADWIDMFPGRRVRSYLGAPIQVGGEVIGFIHLTAATPCFFGSQHAERLRAFADQAAIAIQNARLYERAQELAALEERQRLARELHDSVSQTLGSVSLMADVLPKVWSQDQEEGERVLERLREQTRGALAEMRTLLLELRPSALVEARLGDLMRHLAAAAMSHKRLQVSVTATGRCSPPPDVQLAIYRIAQETIQNVCMHSRATRASVNLRCTRGHIELRIRDNGKGFHLNRSPGEHLGLGIMRERAESIQARLLIQSRIGRGTCVSLDWAAKRQRRPSAGAR